MDFGGIYTKPIYDTGCLEGGKRFEERQDLVEDIQMSVLNALNAAIYSQLNAATALTSLLAGTTAIYYQQAPDEAAYDYVVFSHPAGGPENIYSGDLRDQLVFVRGYSNTGPAAAGSIDAQISASLHGGSINVSGYTNFWLVREQDFSLVEAPPRGERVYMAGANYRIRLDN